MEKDEASYYVILDANVWITDRLLKSSVGSALLYALVRDRACLGLPEVVEVETKNSLLNECELAIGSIRKSTRLLTQIAGRGYTFIAPSSEAIREGIDRRWNELLGLTKRIPFTFEQAHAAMIRIVGKLPPSGHNNEQFRDCCIWESALQLSEQGFVHLVTQDSMFFEGRDRTKGPSKHLMAEVTKSSKGIAIYESINTLLAAIDKGVSSLNEKAITAAVVVALSPIANKLAAERGRDLVLREILRAQIKGYATPEPSIVAITFEVTFKLAGHVQMIGVEEESEGMLTIGGVCTHRPGSSAVSDVEVREWTLHGGRHGMSFWANPDVRNKYDIKNMRLIDES